jgi:hypothetical protein
VIHLLFEWRGSGGPEMNEDVSYARSADGGRTWQTEADQRRLVPDPPLASSARPLPKPITHANSESVIDTIPAGSGLLDQGGLTVDSSGRPHGIATFVSGDDDYFEHVWLDNGAWERETPDDLDLVGRPQPAGTPDGRVWLLGVREDEVVAVDVTPARERLPSRDLAQVPIGWDVGLDSQALAERGVVQMLIPRGEIPRAVEADLGG